MEKGKRYSFGVRRRGVTEPFHYTGTYVGNQEGRDVFWWGDQFMLVRVEEGMLTEVEEIADEV